MRILILMLLFLTLACFGGMALSLAKAMWGTASILYVGFLLSGVSVLYAAWLNKQSNTELQAALE